MAMKPTRNVQDGKYRSIGRVGTGIKHVLSSRRLGIWFLCAASGLSTNCGVSHGNNHTEEHLSMLAFLSELASLAAAVTA